MPSRLHKRLASTERLLATTLIDFPRHPLGRYGDKQKIKSASYIVLVHAAIEQYIEDWCLTILEEGRKQFQTRKRVNRALAFAMNSVATPYPETKPQTDKLSERVYDSIARHKALVNTNNGLKEHNLCKLFFPIGFDFEGVDPLFLPEATSFGSLRGDHAHKSMRNQQFDPYDNHDAAKRFMVLIEGFDRQIAAYAKRNS